MTRHEIATLAIKIFAMWQFAQAALIGSGLVMMFIFLITTNEVTRRDWGPTAATSLPAIGELVIGIVCWRGASRIASRMVSDDPTPVTRPDLTQQTFLSVAFTVIGIWHLLPVLQGLASMFVGIMQGEYRFATYWHSTEWQARFWSNIVSVALSMWLIFGSLGLARLILRLRRPDAVVEPPAERG